MESLIEKIIADLAATTFFQELCFPGQRFSIPQVGEFELCDVFLWLQSEGIAIQVKERDGEQPPDEKAFAKWFRRKVIEKGSKQIADTLGFFGAHPSICVKNNRGLEFELAELNVLTMHKVIVFGTLAEGVDVHHRQKSHLSKHSGFIHLIQAVDFSNLLRWTVSPGEMLAYLRFREAALGLHDENCAIRTEKSIFGSYIAWLEGDGDPQLLSETDGNAKVESLKDDTGESDLRAFVDFLGKWANENPGNKKAFTQMIVELAHLDRAGMREFKTRLLKCMSRLDKPFPLSAYRMCMPARACAFVFGVLPQDEIASNEQRAYMYTCLLKYACEAEKAVGVFVSEVDSQNTATTPVYVQYPWKADAEQDDAVRQLGSHLRPVEARHLRSYQANDAEDE